MTESAVGDGYTCHYCGRFVRWGDVHDCRGGTGTYEWNTPQSYTTQTIPLNTQLLVRIADALERIAVALEKK